MDIRNVKAGILSVSAAVAASLCCLLPLAVVLLGLGSGAFMVVTMQYRTVLLPLGVIGVAAGYYLYFRQRRQCDRLACRFAGGNVNLALLAFATVVVAVAVILDIFPELTSDILQRAM